MKNRILSILAGLLIFTTVSSAQTLKPKGSYLFAEKDGQELFVDFYPAAPGSETTYMGKEKPAIIYVFGGGFIGGTRRDAVSWYEMLTREGYPVFAIDYRLGLRGKTDKGLGFVKNLRTAISMAVEDLFSATAFIVENAGVFGISPDNLVVSGSSAGAIISLQADWVISNSLPGSEILPEGFRYKGVMSFSGAILSDHGKISYRKAPAQTLMFHGIDDKVVFYKGLNVFNWHFAGTHRLTKIFKKGGYVYNTYRYIGHMHDIAASIKETFAEQIQFLQENIILGQRRIIDATLDDEGVPVMKMVTNLNELYGNK